MVEAVLKKIKLKAKEDLELYLSIACLNEENAVVDVLQGQGPSADSMHVRIASYEQFNEVSQVAEAQVARATTQVWYTLSLFNRQRQQVSMLSVAWMPCLESDHIQDKVKAFASENSKIFAFVALNDQKVSQQEAVVMLDTLESLTSLKHRFKHGACQEENMQPGMACTFKSFIAR